MSKRMFCPKCGANDQQTDSYCTRCGQWLPDMDNLNRPRFLWNKTPAQKIRKMRILEALSAGLSVIPLFLCVLCLFVAALSPRLYACMKSMNALASCLYVFVRVMLAFDSGICDLGAVQLVSLRNT
jgi:uncharacterized membrane protein YvbJ